MKVRISALVLCLFMIVSIFVGCGSSSLPGEEEITTVETTTNDITNTPVPPPTSTSETKNDTKKKIVVVQEISDELRDAIHQNILSTLEKSGYSSNNNTEIIEIKMNGDDKKSTDVVQQIKSLRPDIVLINTTQFAYRTVAKPLEGSGIPVVLNLNIENKDMSFIYENNIPKNNITGIYSMPKDLPANAYKLLQRISPTNGKKAVFITVDGRFTKSDVENNLKVAGVELKDYCESKYIEDFQQAVLRYNNDNEVAWMIIGVWPSQKKDGTSISNLELGKWDIANRKKPTISYYEVAVKMGVLAALGIDLPETGSQAAEMAVKILKGEDVKDVKAENPRKINIVLNQKNAKELGIKFPPDILGAAYRIYIDYEGHY